ncbi:MAG: PLxRFG domain-containing protein, partial [Casimicrobium sp.]
YAGMEPETLELFAEMSGAEATPAFQQYLKMTKSNRSAMKRLIERKGVAGFDDDVTRTLAAFITSNARAASKNLHYGEMIEAAGMIPREKGDVVDEAVKLVKFVQNPEEEAPRLRGLLFVQYIGGSVASALVNMTQPITMTYPYLAQFGAAEAAKQLSNAMKLAATGNVVDQQLKAALSRGEAEGIVSPQEIFQLEAEASRNFGNHPWVRKALFTWGSLFSLAEQFNRRASFIAAYNIATARGEIDPYALAVKAVVETQGIYNRANRPNWARGAIGATLFTFKQFSISYLEFLKRLPMRERGIALGVLLLTAGLQGLPGADDLDDVIDSIGQGFGFNTNSKLWKTEAIAQLLGRDAAEFVMRGGSAIPGFPIDVAGRMGLGNLVPGTGVLLQSKTNKSDEIMEAFGAAGGLVKDALKGEFFPLAVRNIAKASDMYATGMYRDQQGRKVVDVSGYDAAMKA